MASNAVGDTNRNSREAPRRDAIVGRLPFCQLVASTLESDDSIIVHLPRASGQGELLRWLRRHLVPALGCDMLLIAAQDYVADGVLQYRDLLKALGRPTKVKHLGGTIGRDIFVEQLRTRATSSEHGLVLLISVSGPELAEHAFELICDVHKVLSDLDAVASSKLRVVVIDDYSLYFYELWRTRGNSKWDIFKREYFTSFSREEFSIYVKECLTTDQVDRIFPSALSADDLFDITGGHYGLIISVLEKLTANSALNIDQIRSELYKSSVVQLLKAALEEDGPRICSRALSYLSPRPTPAGEKLLDQFLRRSGLLRAVSQLTFELIGGILQELVKEYTNLTPSRNEAGQNTGSGLLSRVSTVPERNDDTVIILHFSDLHIGDDFRFTFSGSKPIENPDRLDLIGAIAEDIRRLGLSGRVDGVVISGDFTTRASMAEFLRARDFVKCLLEQLSVDRSRLLLIGGNHDVEWEVPATGRRDPGSGVSRENLEAFFELLGQDGDSRLRSLDVSSRDNSRRLRLIAVDSNYVEGKDAGGIGFVSAKTLAGARSLHTGRSDDGVAEQAHLWLVTHHHVFPVLDAETERARKGRVTIMASAASLLGTAAEMKAEVILHGHEHQPCITAAARWSSTEDGVCKPVAIIGAGSIGAERESLGPFARNHYFILQRHGSGLYARSRMIGDTGLGFVAHSDIKIDL